MGGGSSKKEPEKAPKTVHRLLLLGTGEAGKSTVFKALKVAKKNGFSSAERLDCTRKVIRFMAKFLLLVVEKVEEDKLECCKTELSYLKDLNLEEMPADLTQTADSVKAVWAVCEVKEAFKAYDKDDSTEYIFKRMDIMCIPTYEASNDDILRFRSPTSDFDEVDYDANDQVTLRFIDVGGQRKERVKWNSVGKVTAIIFVTAMDEYDKTLLEDATRNRMKESLLLFRMIATKHFQGLPIILFLNKRDLFEAKIKNVDLSCCFSSYKGGCDYDAATKFMAEQFCNVAVGTDVQTHITCATDVDQMQKVFGALEKVVFAINMKENF